MSRGPRKIKGKAAKQSKCPPIGARAMLSVLDAIDVQQDLRRARLQACERKEVKT